METLMDLKEFYEKIIENNTDINEFINTIVIEAIKINKLNSLLIIMPPLKKALLRLEEKKVLLKTTDGYKINYIEYKFTKYYKILDSTNKNVNFTTLFRKISSMWRGKFGITSNGSRYSLYDKQKAEKALIEFVQNNKDIDSKVIIKANKEFIESYFKDANGYLKYSPKLSTFISGNEKNGYLIEYCYNIMERGKQQSTIRALEDNYGGFGKDL